MVQTSTNPTTGLHWQVLTTGLPRLVAPYAVLIEAASAPLLGLECLIPPAGDWRAPGQDWTLDLEHPSWVLVAVHDLDGHGLDDSWRELPHGLVWRFVTSSRFHSDRIFIRHCSAGPLVIPAHPGRSPRGFFARPHLVLRCASPPPDPTAGDDRAALLTAATRGESLDLADGPLAATVQYRPNLRISSFTDGGLDNLLAPLEARASGIRTWFMEPCQQECSPYPACRAARCTAHDARSASLRTDPEPVSGLALLWEVRLDASTRTLHLRHGLRNHGSTTRRLAAWTLIAGLSSPRMHALLLRDPGSNAPALRVHAHDGSDTANPIRAEPVIWDIPGVHDLPDAMHLDGPALVDQAELKVGLRATDGRAALVLDDTVLLSQVDATAAGPYPEGDLNLTTFRSADILEIEHVGPLSDVAPGATLWLEQTVRLRRLPAGSDLPERVRAAFADQACTQGHGSTVL
jgi:hypothetical protein